jgi:GNAT superfamily N-acetyltransferase
MRVLLATQDGQPVGYAILLTTYSSFLARPTQWIEDLFVLPEARRAGVGRALLGAIARLARRRGCHRIEGVVLAWNRPAHRFYARTGGHVLRDWFLLRYDRPGLERAARV